MSSLDAQIIKNAGDLFRKNGYAATTIKQIAKASGCTTAALYYHFEDGKAHILREVIRSSADETGPLVYPRSDTLEEFLIELGEALTERFPEVAHRFNWIMLQFATLPPEEQGLLQEQVIGIQRGLRQEIEKHVEDEDRANRLAWLVYCAFFGYQQMFTKMQIGNVVDIGPHEFSQFLAQLAG